VKKRNPKNLTFGSLILGLPIFVLLFVHATSAQSVDLAGEWKSYDSDGIKSRSLWHISQTREVLSFLDTGSRPNATLSGKLSGLKITESDGKTGKVDAEGRSIIWSDGEVWTKNLATLDNGAGTTTIYIVLENKEEQYSIWPDFKNIPIGWKFAGKVGPKEECLAYIKDVWVDMRPLSLRKKTDEIVKAKAAEDSYAALLRDLKADLKNFIDDFTLFKITSKWDGLRGLYGKPREEILRTLFVFVARGVSNRETANKIWTSWKTLYPEPTLPQAPKNVRVVN
jgi:MbtH protein